MRYFATWVGFLVVAGNSFASDWPAWRGPTGQGECPDKIPLTWSAKSNVKWKVPLTEPGNSTPILWKDKIFLTQANKGGSVRSLLCLNRADGKTLWKKDVAYDKKERNWNPSWYANASPITDGERVLVSFGSAGMYCYGLDGTLAWKRDDLGEWDHAFGNSSSPVLYGNLAILWCGPNENKGRNFLLAVDKKTGKTVWEKDEPKGSWGTPTISRVNGQDQLVIGMTDKLKGFDPTTGDELWHCKGLTIYVYTSPLVANNLAVAMSGYNGAAFGVKLGGSGDITKDRLWHHPKNTQRVGSGMILGDHVYIIEENGVPHCYELKTGKEVWNVEKRPSDMTWGSMIHSHGRLYVLMRNGDTVVLAANPKYEVLAVNPLGSGEQTNSSLAVSDGEVFIRTFRHLWCIHEEKK